MNAPLQPLSQRLSQQQVKQLVQQFYSRLRSHPRLGHFFAEIEDFKEHEQRIADFWWLTMGGQLEHKPGIDMIGKHLPLGITEIDLASWLGVFRETAFQTLEPVVAEAWVSKAEQIAQRLQQMVIEQKPAGIQIGKRS